MSTICKLCELPLEWTPWWGGGPDYEKGICGFCRESLQAAERFVESRKSGLVNPSLYATADGGQEPQEYEGDELELGELDFEIVSADTFVPILPVAKLL